MPDTVPPASVPVPAATRADLIAGVAAILRAAFLARGVVPDAVDTRARTLASALVVLAHAEAGEMQSRIMLDEVEEKLRAAGRDFCAEVRAEMLAAAGATSPTYPSHPVGAWGPGARDAARLLAATWGDWRVDAVATVLRGIRPARV